MVEDSCICNCATSYISATVLRYTFLFDAKGYDKLKIVFIYHPCASTHFSEVTWKQLELLSIQRTPRRRKVGGIARSALDMI